MILLLVLWLIDFGSQPAARVCRRIEDACDSIDIRFPDLLPAFHSRGLSAADLSVGDGHPDERGHRTIAISFVDFLQRWELVPMAQPHSR